MNPLPWDSLPLAEQITLVKTMDDPSLSQRFNRPPDLFRKTRAYFDSLPAPTGKPAAQEHAPPKDLVLSARRDLSFFEANFELFDNSIDAWRKYGAKKDLHIDATFDLDTSRGKYMDDAGGMPETDVYKVFIPGETTNRDFTQATIGSFGMGAKKGIFRLTDGARIVSCTSPKYAATSEVPERWEDNPRWETIDGRAHTTTVGTTEIYLLKLFNPPTQTDIENLIARAGRVYAPLLAGQPLSRKVHIQINGFSVEAVDPIKWSGAAGVEPRRYSFAHTFPNFLQTGQNITLQFFFQPGLARRLPGKTDDAEADWGVDVFGNGRLIEGFLKDEFGFGTKGLSREKQSSKFFRAQLFIVGHSFAIPWDTHKREYLHDHPVSNWLRDRLRSIIKAYVGVANNFAADSELRATQLSKAFTGRAADVAISETGVPKETEMPKWRFASKAKGARPAKPKPQAKTGEDGNGDSEPESKTVEIDLTQGEFDELTERFAVTSEDDLATVIHDCLTTGIAFPLDASSLGTALKTFKCDGDVGQLSEVVKTKLLKAIK